MLARTQPWSELMTPASASATGDVQARAHSAEYASASGGEARCVTTFAAFGGPRLSQQVVVASSRRLFRLAGPISVSLEYLDEGTVFASHAQLPVHGYGKTFAEALDGFCEMFDSQYRDLVEAPDAQLTPHARRERAKLEAIVAAVEAKQE